MINETTTYQRKLRGLPIPEQAFEASVGAANSGAAGAAYPDFCYGFGSGWTIGPKSFA